MNEPGGERRTQVLRGGHVFDAELGTSRVADVIIEADRIAAIEDVAHRPLEPSDVIDVSGMTVLPGLINLHAHLLDRRMWGSKSKQWELDDVYQTMRGIRSSMAFLKQGFTTIRELAAQRHLNLYLKRMIDAGMFPGPRVLAAGAPISVSGGHGWVISTLADGPVGMRRAVRETIKVGVDWVKLLSTNDPVTLQANGQYSHPEFARDEYIAAVETAHMWGRPITAHTMGRESIEWAIDAGVDSMEHGIYMDARQAERMAKAGIALIPTLSGYHQNTLPTWGRDPVRTELMRKLVEPAHKISIKLAVAAGVRIGLGTDSTGDHVEELDMLVECGMSHAQALRTATLDAARILGLDDRLGSITPGKLADLVVVRGDPLANLHAVREVAYVYQSGYGRRPADIVMPTEDETADWNSLKLL